MPWSVVFSLVRREAAGVPRAAIELTDQAGNVRWSHSLPGGRDVEAFLLADDAVLYAAVYSPSATGCRVLALAVDTGQALWDTPLTGIGSMMHSRYSNSVRMELTNGELAIFGDESGGKYVEVLDPATGRPRPPTRIDR